MCSLAVAPPVATKTKFSAVDAARLALEPGARFEVATPRQRRLLNAAATLWCRDLQFPTVRELGRELRLHSTSSVTAGFGRLIEVQASVIEQEWALLEVWSAMPTLRRQVALHEHAEHLVAIDPVLLRLPGLVWSAVESAAPDRVPAEVGLAAPLHSLAAFVAGDRSTIGGHGG